MTHSSCSAVARRPGMRRQFCSLLARSHSRFPFTVPQRGLVTAVCAIAVMSFGPTLARAQTAHSTGLVAIVGSGFVGPQGVALDARGDVFVAQPNDGILREIVAVNGQVSAASQVIDLTPAFAAYRTFFGPTDVAVDAAGDVFVADYGNGDVEEMVAVGGAVSPTSTVKTILSGLGQFIGITVDSQGDVLIADSSAGRVREIVASNGVLTSTVNTLPGSYSDPAGVAVDASGDVFVAEYFPSDVKEIVAQNGVLTSTIRTVATGLSYPQGLATDTRGDVYIANSNGGAGGDVREVLAVNGSVPATNPTVIAVGYGFSGASGVVTDALGDLFVADYGNSAVREVLPGAADFSTVNVGSTSATLQIPFVFDSAGSLSGWKVHTQGASGLDFAEVPAGTTCSTTTAYAAGDTCTVAVQFAPRYSGLRQGAVDLLGAGGSVMATAYLRGVGSAPQIVFTPPSPSTLASGLGHTYGLAADGNGNIYIANKAGATLLRATPSAGGYATSTVVSGLLTPFGVAVDGAGDLYISNSQGGNVVRETLQPDGSYVQSTVAGGFSEPEGVAVDASGNVYVASYLDKSVVEERLTSGGYVQSTIVGSGLNGPENVAVDASGNVYFTDSGNTHVIRETPNSNGSWTQSLIGSGLSYPYGLAVTGNGVVYVADYSNNDLVMEVPQSGSYTQTTILTGLIAPPAVAVGAGGKVYLANNDGTSALVEDTSSAPSLTFITPTVVGTTDGADGPQSVTVTNIGNATLTFPVPTASGAVNPSLSANFSYDSASTCLQNGAGVSTAFTLAAGASCTAEIDFEPAAVGSISGSLVLTDDNLNATSPTYATQTLAVSGTGKVVVPGAPTAVVVAAGDMQATVSFTPPIDTGGATVTGYVATSSPGGVTGTCANSPCTVTGLVNGTSYIFTVAATNSVGTGSASAPSNAVTPAAGQTITFNNPGSQYLGTSPALTATATSGLPVTFTSATTGVCTVTAGGTLTFVTTGTCTIDANQPGNAAWLAAATVAQSFSVILTPQYVVNTTADDATGIAADCTSTPEGVCTLRDAVAAADALPPGGSPTITFAPGLGSPSSPATILLANGPLSLSSNASITGLGVTALLLDGDLIGNVLEVQSGVTATVADLTMQNARGAGSQLGGAVYNAGNLTLNGVVVQNSTPSPYSGGAGIYNDAAGILTVTNCTITRNGSSYFGGSSGAGGGIFNHGGTVILTGSTLSLNAASNAGGNLYTSGGTVTIADSTITASDGTENGGGLAVGGGTVTVVDSTIARNSAGFNPGILIGGGSVTVTNSIVAANGSPSSTGNCPGCTLTGNNIVDVDPQLAVLGNYGGSTQTLVPLPGSSAICAGAATTDTADQRGFPRPAGSCYDVGAVQTRYAIAFVQQPTNSVVASTIKPPVTVSVLDHSIGIPGASVNLTLTGNGRLSGTLPTTTDTTGTAPFADLAVSAIGAGDTLTAAAGSFSAVSDPFNVTQAALALSFRPSPATQVYGMAIAPGSLDATASNNGSPVSGTFTYSTTVNGSAQTLSAGTTLLPAGAYTITAAFTPDNMSLYAPASTTAAYVVTQAATTTALSLSSRNPAQGQNVTLTATVSDASPSGAGTPGGTVSFYNGATLLDQATLSGGVATYSTTSLAGGTYVLTAVYSGDPNFLSSTSAAVNLTVASLDFTLTTIGSTNTTLQPGNTAAYQVQVAPTDGTYPGALNFAASGLPAGATAAFSPASIPAAGGPRTVLVTIAVPATTAATHPASAVRPLAPIALALLLLPCAGGMRRRGRNLSRLVCLLALTLAASAASLGLSGCGASEGFFAQSAKTYTITLTATAGNLSHAVTVTVNVE